MFVRIGNTPRDYAWGSTSAIAELLGTEAGGGPEAELWLGAHAGSPSIVLSPEQTGGARDLAEWIAADPARALGTAESAGTDAAGVARLPFLLKVLAADGPLSLQAHPTPARAAEGFARENAAGVPLHSPSRNYKDPFHKPELIYAVSERFEALCGFRSIASSAAIVAELRESAAADGDGDAAAALAAFLRRLHVGPEAAVGAGERGAEAVLRECVAWLLGGTEEDGAEGDGAEGVSALVGAVVAASAVLLRASPGAEHAREWASVASLARSYPGDPGIVLSLLLNRVTLAAGEALYLPAGNIHAYLHGVGIELMAASDNVLRGGLTPKHIDIPELLEVLDFRPVPVPYLRATHPAPGVDAFRPDVPDFALLHIELGQDASSTTVRLPGAGILLCVRGEVEIAGSATFARLRRGEAVYATPDEASVTLAGDGTLFCATVNA